MRSSCYLLILALIFSCNRVVTDTENRKFATFRESLGLDESNIDLQESIVYWKGTKLLYTRYHEGTLKFRSGKLTFKEGKISGGHLVVDVNSLKITDIPAHETTAIRNISGHLLEDLSSDQFPSATFDIHSVNYEQYPEFTLLGDLQIKDVKKRVSIVGKIHVQICQDGFFDIGIKNRCALFNSVAKIARHQVCAR